MLKPFYQGKLDTFCAIYAVLNGFRLTHGIKAVKARDIFNETLQNFALKPAEFHAVLNQETDYMGLVDNLLRKQAKKFHLEVTAPFADMPDASEEDFWRACEDWLGESGVDRHRAIVFRFLRYLDPAKPPVNRHWTTADHVRDNILHLFDCSHEAEAILNVRKDSFTTSMSRVETGRLLFIPPACARFLKLSE